MFSPLGGQLPDALVVLGDQVCSDQKCFDDLADGACRQRQPRRQDIQSLRPFGEHGDVLLLVWSESNRVDLFELACSLKMFGRELRFAERTTNTMAGLQHAERQSWRASGS